MLSTRLASEPVEVLPDICVSWGISTPGGQSQPVRAATAVVPPFDQLTASRDELNAVVLWLLQYKYGETNEKFLHSIAPGGGAGGPTVSAIANSTSGAKSHPPSPRPTHALPSTAGSSSSNSGLPTSTLKQLNGWVDAVIEFIRTRAAAVPWLDALQYARTHTTNPLVRQHSVRYAIEWLKRERDTAAAAASSASSGAAAAATAATPLIRSEHFDLVLRAVVFGGLTDVWSAIRRFAADKLSDLFPVFALQPQLETIFDELCRLCDHTAPWQHAEGAVLGLCALLKSFRPTNPTATHNATSTASATAAPPAADSVHLSYGSQVLTGGLPHFIARVIRVVLYRALAHTQLSVREAGVRAFSLVCERSDAATRQSAFAQIIQKLNRGAVPAAPAPAAASASSSLDSSVASSALSSPASAAAAAAISAPASPLASPALERKTTPNTGISPHVELMPAAAAAAHSHPHHNHAAPIHVHRPISANATASAASATATPLLDASEAEGLLSCVSVLVKQLSFSYKLSQWNVYFPALERYLSHPASTVRQATSSIFIHLVAGQHETESVEKKDSKDAKDILRTATAVVTAAAATAAGSHDTKHAPGAGSSAGGSAAPTAGSSQYERGEESVLLCSLIMQNLAADWQAQHFRSHFATATAANATIAAAAAAGSNSAASPFGSLPSPLTPSPLSASGARPANAPQSILAPTPTSHAVSGTSADASAHPHGSSPHSHARLDTDVEAVIHSSLPPSLPPPFLSGTGSSAVVAHAATASAAVPSTPPSAKKFSFDVASDGVLPSAPRPLPVHTHAIHTAQQQLHTWEWKEGRLLTYELIAERLLSDHTHFLSTLQFASSTISPLRRRTDMTPSPNTQMQRARALALAGKRRHSLSHLFNAVSVSSGAANGIASGSAAGAGSISAATSPSGIKGVTFDEPSIAGSAAAASAVEEAFLDDSDSVGGGDDSQRCTLHCKRCIAIAHRIAAHNQSNAHRPASPLRRCALHAPSASPAPGGRHVSRNSLTVGAAKNGHPAPSLASGETSAIESDSGLPKWGRRSTLPSSFVFAHAQQQQKAAAEAAASAAATAAAASSSKPPSATSPVVAAAAPSTRPPPVALPPSPASITTAANGAVAVTATAAQSAPVSGHHNSILQQIHRLQQLTANAPPLPAVSSGMSSPPLTAVSSPPLPAAATALSPTSNSLPPKTALHKPNRSLSVVVPSKPALSVPFSDPFFVAAVAATGDKPSTAGSNGAATTSSGSSARRQLQLSNRNPKSAKSPALGAGAAASSGAAVLSTTCIDCILLSRARSLSVASFSSVLEWILLQTVNCCCDVRWELRRMADQVLPLLVQVMLFFDLHIFNHWLPYLSSQSSFLQCTACLTLKYALRATIELSKQLKPSASTHSSHPSSFDAALLSPAITASPAPSPSASSRLSPAQTQIQSVVAFMNSALPTLLPPLYDLIEREYQHRAGTGAGATAYSSDSDKLVTLAVEILIVVWARFGHTIRIADRTRHFRLIRRRLARVRDAMALAGSVRLPNLTAGSPATTAPNRALSFDEKHSAPPLVSGGGGGDSLLPPDVRASRRQAGRVEQWLLSCTHAFWPALVASCSPAQAQRLLPFVADYVCRYDDTDVRTSLLTAAGALLHSLQIAIATHSNTDVAVTAANSAAVTPTKAQAAITAVDRIDSGRVARGADRCLTALLTLLQHNGTDSGVHMKLILGALRINAALIKAQAAIAASGSTPDPAATALRRVLIAVSNKITSENGGQVIVPVAAASLAAAKKRGSDDDEDGDGDEKSDKADADADDEDDEKASGDDWDDWDDDDPIAEGAGVEKLVPEFGAFVEAIGSEFGGITIRIPSSPPATAAGPRPSATAAGAVSAGASVFDAQLLALPPANRHPIEWLLQRYRQANPPSGGSQ